MGSPPAMPGLRATTGLEPLARLGEAAGQMSTARRPAARRRTQKIGETGQIAPVGSERDAVPGRRSLTYDSAAGASTVLGPLEKARRVRWC